MLTNGKPEELSKYSKGIYNPKTFIDEVKENWDLTDLQIRMTYLVSDLAIKAEGVFSIAHNTFVKMFEKRFKMKVSLSSVRRFFGLLEKLEVLTINAAKRKNNKQSANIYVVEQKKTEEQPEEQPYEQPDEHPYEQHNIPLTKSLTKPLTKPLNNILVNKSVNKTNKINDDSVINKLTNEYRLKGLSKEVCLRVLEEVKQNKEIENFGAYLRTCLENTLYRSQMKRGEIDLDSMFEEISKNRGIPLYNWLEQE